MQAEKYMTVLDEKAESICRWGAARAGIVVIDPMILMANEVNMIIRIAYVYGVKIDEYQAIAFIEAMHGAFVGQALSVIFAPIKIFIGIAGTHAIGKAAQAWIKDDMPADMTKYKDIFESFKKEAKSIVDELSTHPFKNKSLGDEKRYFPR